MDKSCAAQDGCAEVQCVELRSTLESEVAMHEITDGQLRVGVVEMVRLLICWLDPRRERYYSSVACNARLRPVVWRVHTFWIGLWCDR